jgi:hypothetical protein
VRKKKKRSTQARRRPAKAARSKAKRQAAKRESELRRIEKTLGEDFANVTEARAALKAETTILPPSKTVIESIEDFEEYSAQAEDAGFDFEDEDLGGGVET